MWSYYGSKQRIVSYYPKPKHDKIIEPFAGAATYSLKYFENDVLLVDKNQHIITIWEYLQQCSKNDIQQLPILKAGSRIQRSDFDCDGQYFLMRFMIVQAAFGGNNIVSKFGEMRFKTNVKRVVNNLYKIKHWKFLSDCYTNIKNEKATWFIDAPYQHGGHKYPMSNKKIDFPFLSSWVKELQGQVIVCENMKADWLPFAPIKITAGIQNNKTTEAIWTNYFTTYKNLQLQLI